MMSPATDIRAAIVNALEADLIGPFYGRDGDGRADEVLPLPPSRWYLTGFLAPQGNQDPEDPTADDELGAGPDEDDEETGGDEPEPKRKHRFPASMGVSVLLPPATGGDGAIRATVSFAEYLAETREDEERGRSRTVWRRFARDPLSVVLPLTGEVISRGMEFPGTDGIWVTGKLEVAEAPGIATGTQALSLFVVNRRDIGERGRYDERFIFQVQLEVEFEPGFCR